MLHYPVPVSYTHLGTMENYLPAVENHLEHKASDREKKKSVLKGIKEKCAGAKKSEPAKKKMKDHSSPCVLSVSYTHLVTGTGVFVNGNSFTKE